MVVALVIVAFGFAMFALGALFIGPVYNGAYPPFINYSLFGQGWHQGFKVAKFRYSRLRDRKGKFCKRGA